MSVYHIYLERGQKRARAVRMAEEFRALRNTSQQIENLKSAREGDSQAKMKLIQFNYSGHYPNGIVRGNKLPSNTFGFDIDDPEEFATVSKLLLEDPEKYGLLMLERSARQGGHAVFRREKGKTILENQVRIASMLNCEMDTNAHDINRVYFASSASPEDLLYLSDELFSDQYNKEEVEEEANLLEHRIEELPEDAHKANKHYRPMGGLSHTDLTGKESHTELTELTENNHAKEQRSEEKSVLSVSSVRELKTVRDLNYQGIPYSDIVSKWWEMYNSGQEPVKSNRDVLTYELAVNLRHICGFDRDLMSQIIPCYDDFPLQQKMKCIDSALAEKRTQMPLRLKNVLQALRKDYIGNSDVQEALDEVQLEDELFYFKRLPQGALPQGVIDSIKAAGEAKAMPVINAVCPMIGALATNVQVEIHGVPTHLNLISFVAGRAGSGKGSLDPIVEQWMYEIQAQDDIYHQQEEEYREKKKKMKNAKEQPQEIRLPVRFIPLNNTLPNIAERLANTDGIHSFSFTPEADTVTARWKSALCDYSVMLRQAYDGTRYDREAKSAEAVNVHIKKLLWNCCLCGTPDALYRLISNYTDGLLSRICLSRLPDNTFTPLSDKPIKMLPQYEDRIRQIAHLLPLMQGTLVLPKLEKRSRDWVEKIRLEAMMNNDTVLADARLRDHVNAQRMTTCLILCLVAERLIKQHGFNGAERMLKTHPDLTQEMAVKAQTDAMMEAYDVIADSLIDNDMYFFRDRIEAAYSKNNEYETSLRAKRGKNDSIFARLGDTFGFDQALQHSIAIKGTSCTRNSVRKMLVNWRTQGLIVNIENGLFQKISG